MDYIDYGSTKQLDSAFIRACLEKMDPDVAARFILSGVSLDKTKIEDAFVLACKEMQIRALEKEKNAKENTEAALRQSTPSEKKERTYGTEPNTEITNTIKDLLQDVFSKNKKTGK